MMGPKHYSYSSIEPYWLAVDWSLGTEIHNCLKYICRRFGKGTYEDNRDKWRAYLKFAVSRGGDLMVGLLRPSHELKPWQVELAWELTDGTEEFEIFWAIWTCVKNGGDVDYLAGVFRDYCEGGMNGNPTP